MALTAADKSSARVAEIKTQLLALTPTQITELQDALWYRRSATLMKANGRINLFLGLFNLWLGTSGENALFVDLFQTIGGVILIGVSLWLINAPSARAALAFSVLLFVFGTYNVGVSAYYDFAIFAGILGMLQLWWAYRQYLVYQKLNDKPIRTPSPEALSFSKQVGEIFKEKQFLSDPDLMVFRLKQQTWSGWLLGDYGIFVSYQHNRPNPDPVVIRKADMNFAPKDDNQLSKKRINGVFQLDDLSAQGDINQEALGRFRAWKYDGEF